MGYRIGDTVVYPHHGAAVIEKREKRVHDGATCDYFVLRMAYGDLTLMVPEEKCEQVGIRPVVSKAQVKEVLAILQTTESKPPKNWSRRFKANYERLKSGDIFQIAEAVRNLANYDLDNGLSAGERRMYGTAKELLFGELSAAMDKNAEQVSKIVMDLLPEKQSEAV